MVSNSRADLRDLILLRRWYSYVDGIDRTSGAPATGVLFRQEPRQAVPSGNLSGLTQADISVPGSVR